MTLNTLSYNCIFPSQTKNLILILVPDTFMHVNEKLSFLWRQPLTRKYVWVYTVKRSGLNCLNFDKGLAVEAPGY